MTGAVDPCMKHENIQGRMFCTDVAKSSIVVRPYFSQLFHKSNRRRIAASLFGDRAAMPKRYAIMFLKYAVALFSRRILMKKNLKLLTSFLIIVLTLASPQASHGMQIEHEENHGCYHTLSPLLPEIKRRILKEASISNMKGSDGENPLKRVKLVCHDWRNLVNGAEVKGAEVKGADNNFVFANEIVRSAYSLSEDDYKIYQRFLNGVLIYRLQEGSDVGRIDLRISDLLNPLEGTFDLSQCGDTGQYLSISTGYRKGKRLENASKVEIWFAPRFLIEKELTTTAAHFQAIYGNWNESAAVGMFWTWGNWAAADDDMDYLTTENMDNLSKIDLYENWKKSKAVWAHARDQGGTGAPWAAIFHVLFEN